MKSRIFSIVVVGISLGIFACAQSEFSGGSGQGVRSSTPPGGNPPDNNEVPPGSNPPNNDKNPNGLSTDDGGEIKIIETTLTINSNSDHAKFKNCVQAKLTNLPTEPAHELGCNRSSPYGAALARQSAKMKVQTNTCNVMNISFTSQTRTSTNTLSTSANSSRFIIKRTGPNSFNVMANDNNDSDWNDLNLDIIGDGSFKFTIEGQGNCQ